MATIKVKQIKSRIGAPKNQKRTLDSMGLKKLNQIVELQDNASVRDQIQTVHHLVKIVD